jgi:hypothetical protein
MKLILVTFLLFLASFLLAQECDFILLKNGTEINGLDVKIGPNEISYRKCDNPNGPLFLIEKKSVLRIKNSNGENIVIKKINYFSKSDETTKKEIILNKECLTTELKDGTKKEVTVIAFKKKQIILRPCTDGIGFGINYTDLKKIEGEDFVLYFD